ncbi:MAG: 50S ribosomal protein L18 [Patescibacteria group bacterium]
MNKKLKRLKNNKLQRQKRVRAKIFGTSERPRLNVFRSNRGLYLQLIDDSAGKTLVSVNSKEVKEPGTKTNISAAAGKLLAQKALAQGINHAVFDRRSHKYHGRIKAVAEAARAAGIKI